MSRTSWGLQVGDSSCHAVDISVVVAEFARRTVGARARVFDIIRCTQVFFGSELELYHSVFSVEKALSCSKTLGKKVSTGVGEVVDLFVPPGAWSSVI